METKANPYERVYSIPIRHKDIETRFVRISPDMMKYYKKQVADGEWSELLVESEWRSLGIQMSRGWVHFGTYGKAMLFSKVEPILTKI